MKKISLTIYNHDKSIPSDGYILRAAEGFFRDLGREPPKSVERTAGGKPYFNEDGIFVSLSHSAGYVAVAVSGVEVGVDLQVHKRCNQSAIAKRFFHPSEQEFLADNPGCFFDIWALKESFAKLTGKGIIKSFQNFSVADSSGLKHREQGVFLFLREFSHEFSLAIASGIEAEITVIIMT